MTAVSPIPSYTVSIVEDEEILREELAFQLEPYGFAVKTFEDAVGFYRYLVTRPRTLAVLDIGLPGEDGLSICQHLRSCDSQIGIVFMTARGLKDERLTGLEAGADAYLVKPVDVKELVLILRRLGERLMAGSTTSPEVHTQAWCIDERMATLVTPNGVRIRLSLNEMLLLRPLLTTGPGDVCTHRVLSNALSESPETITKHQVEVIISRLRERVWRLSGIRLPLQSQRGLGYVFQAE